MFDGVHRGHRFVLEQLRHIADEQGYDPAVITFSNHPKSVITPGKAPKLLSSVEARIDRILETGIDDILILEFDEELMKLAAAEFARIFIKDNLKGDAVLLGYDHSFGSDRLKGAENYRKALAPLGMKVFECPAMPGEKVSSSMVRRALETGDIEKANGLLGYKFRIEGEVVHGKQLGRTIGFPTANILADPKVMVPLTGVYAGLSDNIPVMLNIGHAPTVNNTSESPITIEAHLIDNSGKELDLYGKNIAIDLFRRLRDEKRFDNLESLREALEADRLNTLKALGRHEI